MILCSCSGGAFPLSFSPSTRPTNPTKMGSEHTFQVNMPKEVYVPTLPSSVESFVGGYIQRRSRTSSHTLDLPGKAVHFLSLTNSTFRLARSRECRAARSRLPSNRGSIQTDGVPQNREGQSSSPSKHVRSVAIGCSGCSPKGIEGYECSIKTVEQCAVRA